jgi:hypothetical protein
MMHHGMLFQRLSLKPHAEDKHGGQQGLVLQEKIMEAWRQSIMDMTQSKNMKWKD